MKHILLAGSSIFEQWRSAAAVAPEAAVTNRAIGGTTAAYWAVQLSPTVRREAPDAVLLYCGSNDFNEEAPVETIMANLLRCRQAVPAGVKFAFFSVIKAPQKLDKFDQIDRLNAAMAEQLPAGDLYVETNDVFLPAGRPMERFYVEDGLHLTDEAYQALTDYARPIVEAWLRADD